MMVVKRRCDHCAKESNPESPGWIRFDFGPTGSIELYDRRKNKCGIGKATVLDFCSHHCLERFFAQMYITHIGALRHD